MIINDKRRHTLAPPNLLDVMFLIPYQELTDGWPRCTACGRPEGTHPGCRLCEVIFKLRGPLIVPELTPMFELVSYWQSELLCNSPRSAAVITDIAK